MPPAPRWRFLPAPSARGIVGEDAALPPPSAPLGSAGLEAPTEVAAAPTAFTGATFPAACLTSMGRDWAVPAVARRGLEAEASTAALATGLAAAGPAGKTKRGLLERGDAAGHGEEKASLADTPAPSGPPSTRQELSAALGENEAEWRIEAAEASSCGRAHPAISGQHEAEGLDEEEGAEAPPFVAL